MRAVRADEPARLQLLGPALLVLQLDGGAVRRVVEGGEPDALLDLSAERGEPPAQHGLRVALREGERERVGGVGQFAHPGGRQASAARVEGRAREAVPGVEQFLGHPDPVEQFQVARPDDVRAGVRGVSPAGVHDADRDALLEQFARDDQADRPGADHQDGPVGAHLCQAAHIRPPLTSTTLPLTYELSCEARNTAVAPISEGRPRRPDSRRPR
ncbi:hypothetical protein RKD48_004818 [Streptomyces ambofaciens]